MVQTRSKTAAIIQSNTAVPAPPPTANVKPGANNTSLQLPQVDNPRSMPPSSQAIISSPVTTDRHLRSKHQTLRQIYYNPSHPASFSSPRRLFRASRIVNRRIKLKDVLDWLSSQKTYVLHKYTRTEFDRRKVLVRKHQHQYQADLMYVNVLEKDNDGVKYLMIIIDCFSRFLAIVPMKERTANASLKALKIGFKAMKKLPKKFQTDGGSEFFNNLVSNYLRSNGIVHFSSSQHDIKAQMAERVIRSLREDLHKYMMRNNTLRYLPVLQSFVNRHNNRKHSAFEEKFAPSEINDKNYKEVYDILYKDYFDQLNKQKFDFKIGDVVLLAVDKKSGKLGKMTQTFKEDEYIIFDRFMTFPPVYRLKYKSNGVLKKGTYYAEQLQKISPEGLS